MLELIERLALHRAASLAVAGLIAWLMAHVNGHYGITIDPAALAVTAYGCLEYARHLIVAKWPWASAWLS